MQKIICFILLSFLVQGVNAWEIGWYFTHEVTTPAKPKFEPAIRLVFKIRNTLEYNHPAEAIFEKIQHKKTTN
jgi:hypothetical protein